LLDNQATGVPLCRWAYNLQYPVPVPSSGELGGLQQEEYLAFYGEIAAFVSTAVSQLAWQPDEMAPSTQFLSHCTNEVQKGGMSVS